MQAMPTMFATNRISAASATTSTLVSSNKGFTAVDMTAAMRLMSSQPARSRTSQHPGLHVSALINAIRGKHCFFCVFDDNVRLVINGDAFRQTSLIVNNSRRNKK